jgi:FkbM family methyltransferase
MKVGILEHEGIKFEYRQGFSDKKTFEEVIVGNTYEKPRLGFIIEEGEHWVDLGGNVGAFALKALSSGASFVDIYEPDPFNCKMIERNMAINNFKNFKVHQKAVVSSDVKKMKMYVGNDMQTWRNSLYKDWGNQSFNVECVHYLDVIKTSSCVKMDIEGAEIPILEDIEVCDLPRKMVFEWSFDVNPVMSKYKGVIDKLRPEYKRIFNYSNSFYKTVDYKLPGYIFPKCDNVYCAR